MNKNLHASTESALTSTNNSLLISLHV